MNSFKFLNSDKAAEFLGIKKSTLYKLTSERKIPFYKPSGKLILFKEAELEKWIENSKKDQLWGFQ
ncbi:MAG: hypothetical protein CL840_08915 [Crocinitomicaceae bacterium]|nr:hypothetical protein [Crocinitomicaceae bacterium]|tara:strand:- start:35967 stop:36164 length:198 start_codon:yes stop_codon:yes gene_type:complete